MKLSKDIPDRSAQVSKARLSIRLFWGGVLLVLIFLLLLPNGIDPTYDHELKMIVPQPASGADPVAALKEKLRLHTPNQVMSLSAEEIIKAKLITYGRNRRAMAEKLAKLGNRNLPDDVLRFFEALEAGHREEADKLFDALRAKHNKDPMEIGIAWRPIQEAGGVNWELMNWPAQQVLDYGEKVLGALKPGMIYLGGTDPGAFLISFLNETSDGEHHVVMTQNALADGLYLDHLTAAYGDKMKTLTEQESKKALQIYTDDLEKRIAHDAMFPEEPKQVRRGEKYTRENGKLEVSGPIAVMDINERLLHTLLDKNPGLSFGIEESFPFKSTYGEAAVIGPIMELRASAEDRILTPEKAANSVRYWREQADLILSDGEAAGSPFVLKTYSKTATSQANMLLERGFAAESEQAYGLALMLYPGNIETIDGLLNVYSRSGRTSEAHQLYNDFVRKFPEQKSAAEALYQDRFGSGSPRRK